MQNLKKVFKVKFEENWYWSLESAYISITTPKGTYLKIEKWAPHRLKTKWDKNQETIDLVWSIYERAIEARKVGSKEIEMTAAEIFTFARCSNQQDNLTHLLHKIG